MIDYEPEIRDDAVAGVPDVISGAVSFRGFTYSYPQSPDAAGRADASTGHAAGRQHPFGRTHVAQIKVEGSRICAGPRRFNYRMTVYPPVLWRPEAA